MSNTYTTHSFVNRFVLAPYAELLSLLPDERTFAAIDVQEKCRNAARYAENLINWAAAVLPSFTN
jgi:hypothetical protein